MNKAMEKTMPYEQRCALIKQRSSVLIHIPQQVMQRAAREAGLSVESFVESHVAIFAYGDPTGGTVRFERKESTDAATA